MGGTGERFRERSTFLPKEGSADKQPRRLRPHWPGGFDRGSTFKPLSILPQRMADPPTIHGVKNVILAWSTFPPGSACYSGVQSKRTKKGKQDPLISHALVGALAKRFVWLGETDINSRLFQGAGSEAREEGRERGKLIETTSKQPVDQRACWIFVHS